MVPAVDRTSVYRAAVQKGPDVRATSIAILPAVRQNLGNFIIALLIISIDQLETSEMGIDEPPKFVVHTSGSLQGEGRAYACESRVFMQRHFDKLQVRDLVRVGVQEQAVSRDREPIVVLGRVARRTARDQIERMYREFWEPDCRHIVIERTG